MTHVGDVVFDATMDSIGVSGVQAVNVSSYTVDNLPETLYLPAYTMSPEEIIKGDVLFFNVDFFSDPIEIKEEWGPVLDENGNPELDENGNEKQEIKSYYYEDEDGNKITTSPQNMAEQLRDTISSWYVSLRNIALVMMMIVLLYIGIRMLISTLASDKAKYRQMLYDWLVGLVILFFMHYIMAFSVTLVNQLTKVVSSRVDENGFTVIIPDDTNSKLTDYIKSTGNEELKEAIVNEKLESDENGDFVVYPTNLLGKMRLELQLANWGTDYIGYAICFIVLVLYTLFFAFTYTKRVLYMAFLTLMAPLVAVTYPIDKVSDGSAQGFNKWLKEYVFNLLIQPMHLLLYYILVTSAFDLASENLIYSLVAIGFMLPAEKLLRSFFGFEKASTPGAFAGAAGGALAMQGINKLGSLMKGGSKNSGSGSSSGGSSDSEGNTQPKMRGNVDEAMLTSGENENNNENNNESENNNVDAGGPSAADATEYNNEDPVKRAERENLEEKLADGQLTEDELTPEQKQMLGLGGNQDGKEGNNEEGKDDEPQITARRLGERHRMVGAQRKSGGRIKRKLKSVSKGVAASAKYKLKKAPGYMAKGLVRFAGAGGLAAVGVAAGIATGDPSNAFAYGATAGGVGLGVTNTMLNQKLGNEQYRAARDSVRNSPEFEELNAKEYMKKFKKDNKDLLVKNFDKEKAKEMAEKGGIVDQFLDNNISDIDDIMAAQKMIDDGDAKDIKEAIAFTKYANRVGSDYNTDKREKWVEAFADEYKRKVGLDDARAKKTASQTMNKVATFNKKKKTNYK